METLQTEIIPEPEIPEKKYAGIFRFILDIVETLILATVLFLGINAISARIRVDGFSMEPTLHNGEFVIVNKLAYKLGSPKIGDVVVFRYPRDPSQEYIKRVIGLSGDDVSITGGQVYVNGNPIEEPYIAAQPAYHSTWKVPEGSLFVLGDNRNNSSDSHTWGPLPEDDVIGKAILVYWPPQEWGTINHTTSVQAAP